MQGKYFCPNFFLRTYSSTFETAAIGLFSLYLKKTYIDDFKSVTIGLFKPVFKMVYSGLLKMLL